ncbi:uncharacterized protein DFL_002914 [Arthrobotrys flagrans]|uniref:F-box domain-containing protein n=1 Tax=Arthrobotrys flagrans TaxID=97331 RepID=A0A437AD53_ARTFL|nr:hypothetical protein DFL_002914 [Arthrobotrys flagrans]
MSQFDRESPASLATLPTEIADSIYYSLPSASLCTLARVSRDIYAAVQGPLYRRPVIDSYRKLQAFVKTLNYVASWDKKTGDARSKKIVHLTLIIDPAKEEITAGRPLIAVILARMIRVIARYNEDVTISLIIAHSACNAQPVCSFESEEFPRVTSLILDLGGEPVTQPSSGSSSLSSVIPARRNIHQRNYNYSTTGIRCIPNAKFWTRFFNGSNFPDLQRLELHHRSRAGSSYGDSGREGDRILFTELDTLGLARIERLVVNSVPEFNDSVLMAGLQHAPLLTDLQIENCAVTYDALDKLLLHALPVLHRLVLRVSPQSRFAQHAREALGYRGNRDYKEEIPHLCPHFRRHGKNLKHFEFAAPYICRDLFLDEYEKEKLRESGHPGTLAGDKNGMIVQGELDTVLVTGVLTRSRQTRDTDSAGQKLLEGSSMEEDRRILERERSMRTRKATIEKEGWTRRLHVLDGMCIDGATFEELTALAKVEEPGIGWTLGSLPERRAFRVIGDLIETVRYSHEFERDRQRRARQVERDVNDELVGQ